MKSDSPIEQDKLRIYRGKHRAGILSRVENGCQFEYDSEFLANPNFTGLSYRMLKDKSTYKVHGVNLHPFFAGLLPEGMRLRSLIRSAKTSEDDLFSLFAAAGTHVVGDVYVKDEEAGNELPPPTPKLSEIDFYEYFQNILNRGFYSVREDALAGVQDKISASMISFPLNIAKATKSYILKLNPIDKAELVQNEYHCMNLASRCGIETAKVKLVKDKNKNFGLLVERFDRIWDEGQKEFQMVHQEDACQFLDRYPADKYKISFNEIAAGIVQIATAPQASLLKLLRLYCFSYVIGNGDLHAKNISLFTDLKGERIDITPAYDVLSTHVYGDRNMAIMFDGKKDNLKAKQLIAFAQRFGIPELATSRMLAKLIKDMGKHKDILRNIPIEQKQIEHLMRVVEKRLTDLSV